MASDKLDSIKVAQVSNLTRAFLGVDCALLKRPGVPTR